MFPSILYMGLNTNFHWVPSWSLILWRYCLYVLLSAKYRVPHETWQLVNGFECLLPYIILDIKDFFQFISLTNPFTQIYFTLKSIFYKMTTMLYFSLFSFVLKNLTNYGRRHLKLFTNWHVSWDTLYIPCNPL